MKKACSQGEDRTAARAETPENQMEAIPHPFIIKGFSNSSWGHSGWGVVIYPWSPLHPKSTYCRRNSSRQNKPLESLKKMLTLKHSWKLWNYMAQWGALDFWGGFVPCGSGMHTFLIHFTHIRKSPKRCLFLSKECYKREFEMALFSWAKWNTFMFYSCKVKTLFLCSVIDWICSCKLLLRKEKNKKHRKVFQKYSRDTKAPFSGGWKLRRPMERNRSFQRQLCFFIYCSKESSSKTSRLTTTTACCSPYSLGGAQMQL